MCRLGRIVTFVLALGIASTVLAQIDARMLRYPDVSKTHITFVYGGDIWVVAKDGGVAHRLSSPEGSELFPRFSPDGKTIAFSGNYDGNTDIYTIPTMGGTPVRLTHHGMMDRMVDWHPRGKRVLYASSMSSGRQRYNQFYLTSSEGGMPEKLPLPYAEFGDFSPDGEQIAFLTISRAFRTWKRYRGGMAPDIWLFNLKDQTSEKITDHPANDTHPMWHGNHLYFLSDRGENKRYNIWKYSFRDQNFSQITAFTKYDIHFPAIGPEEIIFEAGGRLYLLDLSTDKYSEVQVSVVADQASLKPRIENVSGYLHHAWISPDGKRTLIEARGDIFSVPAEHGYIRNLTRTPGIAERTPAWSPDGKEVVYWSDRSGEYELVLRSLDNPEEETTLTSLGAGYRYQPYWSPDGKKLAFIDHAKTIRIYDRETEQVHTVDQGLWMSHGPLENFSVSWSSDSRWMAYDRGLENRNSAIFLYDYDNKSRHQVTSGYYSDARPAFDPDGNYLYFLSNRTFNPLYSDVDNSFIYPNTTNIVAVSLREDVPSPLEPRNDEVEIEEDEEDNEEDGENGDQETDDEENAEEVAEDTLTIDLEGFEERLTLLPPEAGNYSNVAAVSGKVIYHRMPRTGSSDEQKPVRYFELEEREEKTILEDADSFLLSANEKKLLVMKSGAVYIVDAAESQTLDSPLPTTELEMKVDPMAEWQQIFNDAWRLQRDFFYDPNMHGVDWKKMRKRYGALIDDCLTRWDVNYVIGELIGELNASHTYRGGGDTPDEPRRSVGYLGVDWEIHDGAYRIRNIIRGATWDADVKSPLAQPDVDVAEGDYILAVNGERLGTSTDPWAGFQGLAGKTVELTVNDQPEMEGARQVIVEAMESETRLRHLAWIESNRKRVEQATDGKIGYIYVRSTGVSAQNELVRQFAAQFDKQGLIIDERFNSGGQIPDRFVELLNRPPLAYFAVRHGKDWQWPPVANFGPKVMLINGWSGSGGDAFPDFFRKQGLGPLIGARTWGGLIGISGAPRLIDNGYLSVPTFRMYDPDGEWFEEGHGVEPDIPVQEDPGELSKGTDVQLERAIEEVMQRLQENPPPDPERPPYEDRTP